MKHPFEILKPEYEMLLSQMVITKSDAVNVTVTRLLRHYRNGDYGIVSQDTGIPLIFIAPSFEREASSNFALSPAQGDRWDRPSVHVPAHRGPFRNWTDAAKDAYHLNGLDAVGKDNWTWPLLCYDGELFNGFGPRDHHKHTGYLWGGTNIYDGGKYIADHVWDPNYRDTQLGVIPMAKRLVDMEPELALPGNPWPFPDRHDSPPPLAVPIPSPFGLHNALGLQQALNKLGQVPPIAEDGHFGKETNVAVRMFQSKHGLSVDGVAGTQTWATIDGLLKGK
jgi:lysozyme family protein